MNPRAILLCIAIMTTLAIRAIRSAQDAKPAVVLALVCHAVHQLCVGA